MLVLLIATAIFAFPSKEAKSETPKKAANRVVAYEPNTQDNPGFKLGARCDFNVELLIDRSGSILSGANPAGSQTDANAIKATVNDFLDSLANHANATGLGSNANVFTDAFATYSIEQNGPAPDPSMGLTSWNWLNSINLTDPSQHQIDPAGDPYPSEYRGKTNLEYQKDVVNNIWYPNSPGSNPFNPNSPRTAFKGYLGGTRYAPDRNTGLGGTNWEDALTIASQRIRFWTGSSDPDFAEDYSVADKDFDLVIMVTDGVPTLNNGPDHVPTPGEPSLTSASWVDQADVMNAKNAVNALRTGGSIEDSNGRTVVQSRPKTNVIGIMAGGYADNPSAPTYLKAVFGEEDSATVGKNWYLANNFTNGLGDALQSAIDTLGCVPRRVVHPSIDLTATPNTGEITEGESKTIDLTVTNTGDVKLVDVNIEDYDGNQIILGESLEVGESKTFTYTISVAMGTEGPIEKTLYVVSRALLESTDVVEPLPEGTEGDPAQPWDSEELVFTVKHLPLPS